MPETLKSINELIDLAKINGNFSSYNKLAIAVGISSPSMFAWRKNRAWPSDDHIEALSQFAGLDPDLTQVELQIWKNEGPAKARWIHIFERLTATAAAVLILISVALTGVGSPSPVTTANRA